MQMAAGEAEGEKLSFPIATLTKRMNQRLGRQVPELPGVTLCSLAYHRTHSHDPIKGPLASASTRANWKSTELHNQQMPLRIQASGGQADPLTVSLPTAPSSALSHLFTSFIHSFIHSPFSSCIVLGIHLQEPSSIFSFCSYHPFLLSGTSHTADSYLPKRPVCFIPLLKIPQGHHCF